MSNHDEALEIHKRKIASLTVDGLTNTIEQEFDRSSAKQKPKSYRGVCPVCKQPFIVGYAVRCTETKCKGQIFHADCFGSHTMKVHQPASVTIILKETDNENVWAYVDLDGGTKHTTIPVARIPINTEDVEEKPAESPASITYHGLKDDSTLIPSAELDLPTPKVPPIVPSADTERELTARETRSKRTKKRMQERTIKGK